MTIVPDLETPEASEKKEVVVESGATEKVVAAEKSKDGEPSVPETEEQRIEVAVQAALDKQNALIEDQAAQSQKDLNELRSSLDSQKSTLEKGWQAKESELQSQIHQLNMANMDEGERKQYELNVVYEETDRLRKNITELEGQVTEGRTAQEYIDFFVRSGIDPTKLVRNQGLQGVVQSGWEQMTEKIKSLEGQIAGGGTKETVSSTDNKKPPAVVTKKGPVSTGPSWDELKKKHGSEERVYQLVQEGRLPPSTIPGGSED